MIDSHIHLFGWEFYKNKSFAYYAIMSMLALLCVAGIAIFIKNIKHNYWWRWIYVCGGGYVLFDLFAIAIEMEFWQKLLGMMFDTSSAYWNYVWLFFILLGGLVFVLGLRLLVKYKLTKPTT